MALSPGEEDGRSSSVRRLPARVRSSSPTGMMRSWNPWLKPPPRPPEQGQHPGNGSGRDMRIANHVSWPLSQVTQSRSTSKTPIVRIRFNEKVLVYIFSNHTQRAMSITSSWISQPETNYTTSNSNEKLYIYNSLIKFQIHTKFFAVLYPHLQHNIPNFAAFLSP